MHGTWHAGAVPPAGLPVSAPVGPQTSAAQLKRMLAEISSLYKV